MEKSVSPSQLLLEAPFAFGRGNFGNFILHFDPPRCNLTPLAAAISCLLVVQQQQLHAALLQLQSRGGTRPT